jgi:DNA helicase-2/ATP-dependent DNA helicase PcrA
VDGQAYPNLVDLLADLDGLEVSEDGRRALERGHRLIARLSSATRGLSALETAQHVIRALDFNRRFPPASPEGDQAWRNLADFLRVIHDYESTHNDEGLRGFVEYLNYAERRGEGFEEREPDSQEDSVKILTHHRAKGLEFPLVFIPNCYSGSMPAKKQWDWLEEYNVAPDAKDAQKAEHEAEERRTFFVAMTRAEQELVLSRPRERGGKEVEWSPFVQELSQGAPGGHVVSEDVQDCLEPAEAHGTPAKRLLREKLHALLETPSDSSDAEARLRELVGVAASTWTTAGVRAWAGQVGAVMPADPVPEVRPQRTLRLTATALADYKDCPQKYQYRHDYVIPGRPSPTAVAGSNVHRALEVFHKEHMDDWRDQDTDVLLAIHDRVFASGRYRSQDEADQYRAWERNILERYLKQEKAEAGEPKHFEVGFEFKDDELDVVFHGFIDRVDEHSDGTVEIIDYKTGNPANLNRFQMPLYVLGGENDRKWHVRAATYYLMRDAGDGKGPIERKRIPRTETGKRGVISDVSLADMHADIEEIVQGIRSHAFPAKPEDFKCGMCDYRILCPAYEGGSE